MVVHLRLRRRIKNLLCEVEEFHVEKIYDDQCFITLTRFIRKYPKAVLMLMVEDEGWTELQKNCAYRKYKQLASNFPNEIGLHVHLTGLHGQPLLPLPKNEEQHRKISYGLKFLNKIGLNSHVFASGRWSTNNDTLEVCKYLGLTEVHVKKEHLSCSRIPEGITLKYVRNFMHDYACY